MATEGTPGQQMTPEQAYMVGMKRESWCAVEMKKEQDWCRAERKHWKDQFSSEVFKSQGPSSDEPRCSWSVNKPTHLERRHYKQQCKLSNAAFVVSIKCHVVYK